MDYQRDYERGLVSVRRGGRRGNTLVEFALVVLFFFLLVFGLIDFGRLFFTELTLQHALRQAGRFAVTGNHLPDPDHANQQLPRVDSIISVARQAAVGIPVDNIQVSSQVGGAGSAGGPSDTMTISLNYDLPMITPMIRAFFPPDGIYHFTVKTTFKNEPFPEANTR